MLCQLGACVCAEMGSHVRSKPSPACKPAQDKPTPQHVFATQTSDFQQLLKTFPGTGMEALESHSHSLQPYFRADRPRNRSPYLALRSHRFQGPFQCTKPGEKSGSLFWRWSQVGQCEFDGLPSLGEVSLPWGEFQKEMKFPMEQ